MDEPVILDRRKLFEQVAAHLEREILAGKLKPGERLPPERDLQAMFGVGRPAIREALIILQRSGLIEIGNGAPARVATPTVKGVLAGLMPAVHQIIAGPEGQRQLQGVRLFMEVGLVRHAALNATADDLQRLGAALENNRLTIGNTDAFIGTDVAFHYVFAQIIGNPAFLALHDAMSRWLLEQRRVALLEPGEDKAGFAAHKRIFKAVADRDPDAAEAAMRAHLEAGWVSFWKRYASVDAADK
jgi:GntR family transcriptional repressor for pyruvate dehydrogenase complex